ncbi:MAG: glycosyltransferase family 2 protein [Clostridium sp.]|nr:glycosyltransferase family 2 protein [Clostridium sp.]MCM1209297.1 glycosyltransferase family 2 protein [Ruminococcus sp.]
MKDLTAAGIVLYNPDINRIKENINAVINQVDYVILVDNGSKNKSDIEAAISHSLHSSDKLIIRFSQKNNGIAWALNQIFKLAEEQSVTWVLTLDQDSVCPSDMMERYIKYASTDKSKIGILCPTIVDKNAGVIEGDIHKTEAIKRCITSGSFTSLAAWKQLGGFDEKMFIDGVDFDFCDRLRTNGYNIIRIGSICLTHELGKITTHRFLFKTVKVQNHSALRKYYIVRNRFYLSRKEKKPFAIITSFFFVIKFSATIILFEKNRRKKLKAVFRGMCDGLKL